MNKIKFIGLENDDIIKISKKKINFDDLSKNNTKPKNNISNNINIS